MMSAKDWLENYLDVSGSVNVGAMWQCPAHDDSFPSMSLSEGEGGRVLIYCHAGCPTNEILESLGLGFVALLESHLISPERYLSTLRHKPYYSDFQWRVGGGANRRDDVRMKGRGVHKVSTEYHQYNASHRLVRHRMSDGRKSLHWQQRGKDGWFSSQSLNLAKLPLYQWKSVRDAVGQGQMVVLCESESSVDALVQSGIIATTWAGGAAKPQIETLQRFLSGARLLVVPDNDTAGLKCLSKLEESLSQHVSVWQVKLGLPGEDARDILVREGPEFFSQVQVTAKHEGRMDRNPKNS
jgi:putative DNA primase/helicase